MKAHIFREYDIRGVADRDLTDTVVTKIGLGLATLIGSDGPPTVAVARDCRQSGPRIARSLTRGLTDGGARVLDVGVGPTPKLYFAVHELQADGGVMVTGSHNPGDENGFKIMKGKASFYGDQIRELARGIESDRFQASSRGAVEERDVDAAYLKRLTSDVKLDTAMRVVIDAGNGAAGPLATQALRAAGLDPVCLFCDMDGTFPNHHPDPTVPENLRDLVARVKQEDARVGIAFDGDGDRLGVVDRTGEIIWGDRLLALFARPVLKEHPGAAVIGDVKCSQTLFDDVERHGGRPIMWRTGHSLIKTKMKEENALLAGEMSGHFFFADRYFGYDDALYAALRLLEILSSTGKTVKELLTDLPVMHSTPEIRADCPDALKADVVGAVRAHFAALYPTNEIDGVRVQYPDGAWALVRASNTGPIIVLRFEAPSEERLREVRSQVETELERAIAQADG